MQWSFIAVSFIHTWIYLCISYWTCTNFRMKEQLIGMSVWYVSPYPPLFLCVIVNVYLNKYHWNFIYEFYIHAAYWIRLCSNCLYVYVKEWASLHFVSSISQSGKWTKQWCLLIKPSFAKASIATFSICSYLLLLFFCI